MSKCHEDTSFLKPNKIGDYLIGLEKKKKYIFIIENKEIKRIFIV